MTKTEKRRTTRVRQQARVPVRVEASGVSQEGTTRDISPQGVFLYLASEVTQGTELEILLPIPSAPDQEPDTWVRCQCRVIRVEEVPDAPEFGVAATIEDFETVPQAVTGETRS